MRRVDDMMMRMAGLDLVVVIGMLRGLVDSNPEVGDRDYCGRLNRVTIFVHDFVWRGGVPMRRIRGEIIPLLGEACDKVDEVSLDEKCFRDIRKALSYREGSIRYRYCSGMSNILPEWALPEV